MEEAKFYILNKKYEKAEEILKRALEEFPDNPDLLYNLGIVYELMTEKDKAAYTYRRIIEVAGKGKRREDAIRRLTKLQE